jgi:hypothetical protein
MQFSAEIWRRSEHIQALGNFSKLIGEKSPIRRQRVKEAEGTWAKRTSNCNCSQPSLLPLSAQPPSALSPASFRSQHLLVMGKQRPQQGPLPQLVAVALATTGPDAPSSCSTPSPPLSPSSLEHHSSGPLFSIPNHRRCCHRWFR